MPVHGATNELILNVFPQVRKITIFKIKQFIIVKQAGIMRTDHFASLH